MPRRSAGESSTGVGLRKRPNVEAYEQELIRLRRIEDEERRLEQAAHRLQAKHARPGPLPALPAGEVGQTNRLEVIMRRQEDLIALVEELKGELLEGSAITHQLVQLSRQKADTIKKLDLYRLDQGTWLAVADTDPPGAEKIDWEAIDKGKLGKPLMPVEGASAVRDWLTFREFCEIIDLQARSTLTRWAKGEHLPARRDRRPWEPDWVPVDDTLGTNYRRSGCPASTKRSGAPACAGKSSRTHSRAGHRSRAGPPRTDSPRHGASRLSASRHPRRSWRRDQSCIWLPMRATNSAPQTSGSSFVAGVEPAILEPISPALRVDVHSKPLACGQQPAVADQHRADHVASCVGS